MVQQIHPTALCSEAQIAGDVEIGAYSVIARGAVIGQGTRISDHVSIATDTQVGERVHIGSGARVGGGCIIDADARLGANAVIEDGVRVHLGAYVRAGTAVDTAVPPHAIVGSAQGAIMGYMGAHSDDAPSEAVLQQRSKESHVRGVRVYEMRDIPDLRGALSVGEFDANMPFVPKRYFLVHDVANERIRGEHAHRRCHQFLICTHGVCSLIVDDGKDRQEFRLDRPNLGVHLPPKVWGIQYKFSRDAALLVFASEHYDPADYIRNYDEFLKEVAG